MRTPWRDNIEAMTMAVVMALLLKGFIVEAYKIPTGSMQPTLIGDEHSGIEDRILVDKLTYAFSDPERWDVAVFRYPLDQSQNFVKRIVGVGPEEVRIAEGDLWHRPDASSAWRILRRPPGVQCSAWKRLDLERPEGSSWSTVDGGPEWQLEGRAIRAPGPGTARFRAERPSIMDHYMDGYPEAVVPWLARSGKRSGLEMVGDLRLDGEVRPGPELETLVLELAEGLRRYRFEVPGPAAAPDARPAIAVRTLGRWAGQGGEGEDLAARSEPFRLAAGRPTRFGVQNMDDLLQLELGGEVLLELEVEPCRDRDSHVALELAGGGAELADLMVYRDIHYLGGIRSHVTIPAGHYFMLGDNTQDSSDGREWQFGRYELPGPDGEPRVVRGNLRQRENPRTFGHGDPEGPSMMFVDEFGERHWHRLAETRLLPPESEGAAFVPREMIEGRALAVFWPLDFRRGIYRLEWIH